jgi:N-formylglutamate amidohydrolase
MFTLHTPFAFDAPLLLNSPHSGADYRADFLAQSRLNLLNLRRCEDIYVDELFLNPAEMSLKAHFPRSFLDVNREPFELDPLLIEDELPSFANQTSEKVKVGLGTVPRFGGQGQAIYAHKMLLADALARIDAFYFPYHHALHEALEGLHQRFNQAILLDCHSMPANATKYSGVEIVLGDRFGTSCASPLTHVVQSFFEEKGYRVACNTPFAGGFITSHYGRPELNYHALQIEISRGLYVNEKTLEKTKGFEKLQGDIADLMVHLKKELHLAT